MKYLDRQLDKEFDKVENLTWYPWVGKDYVNSERKILIIGESHYLNEGSDDENKKRKKK